MSLDLPVAVRDPLVLEDDPRRFAHTRLYDIVRHRSLDNAKLLDVSMWQNEVASCRYGKSCVLNPNVTR